MNTKTTILALAAAGLLASPVMITTAGADTAKNCAAAWKGMVPAGRAQTTHKAFLASCLQAPAKEATETAKPAPVKLAGDGCHDYSECTNEQVVSDPK